MTAILSHLLGQGQEVGWRDFVVAFGKPVVSVYTYTPMSTYKHTHSRKRM